jgi:hypothetical protein
LERELADGPRLASELRTLAAAEGITTGPLGHAKKSLGIAHRRVGVRGVKGVGPASLWALDEDELTKEAVAEARAWLAIESAPTDPRAEARERLLDHLLDEVERPDLAAGVRSQLRALADQIARQGLEPARPSSRLKHRSPAP